MHTSLVNPALVIIPTYNERDNVEPICRDVLRADPRTDILIVDDNSPDGTGQLADSIAADSKRVHVLHRPAKQGLGKAYLDAFGWGLARGYQFLLEMDADFSHDPRYLPAFIDAAAAGSHLVIGSRYAPGGGTRNWGLARRTLSRGGSLYARTILGVDVSDLTGGYKCFRREVLEAIDLSQVRSTGYAFQIELTYRALQAGFTLQEIPIVFDDRRVGKSKMSRKIVLEALWRVIHLKWQISAPPQRSAKSPPTASH